MRVTRSRELVIYDLITGPEGFESVAGDDKFSGLDARSFRQILQRLDIEGAVEGDPYLCWTRVPLRHRLRRPAVFVTDAPKLSLAGRSAAPIGLSAVRGNDQVAARRDAGIDRQRLERGEEVRLGDVAGSGLNQLCAP